MSQMDIQTLATPALLMLHQSIRIALEEDDKAEDSPQFEVRQNPEWRMWSEQLAGELNRRDINYKPIAW